MPENIAYLIMGVEGFVILALIVVVFLLLVRLMTTKDLVKDRKREDLLNLAHRLHSVGLGILTPFFQHYASGDSLKMKKECEHLLRRLSNEYEHDAMRREVVHYCISTCEADAEAKRELQAMIDRTFKKPRTEARA